MSVFCRIHPPGATEPEEGQGMLKRILIGVIRLYKRLLSPLLPPACRFYPSCSTYAIQAVERFGPVKGLWLAAKRVMRCHPYHPGGFDPVD